MLPATRPVFRLSALSEKYFGVAKLAKSFGHSKLPKVLATFATDGIPKSLFDDALLIGRCPFSVWSALPGRRFRLPPGRRSRASGECVPWQSLGTRPKLELSVEAGLEADQFFDGCLAAEDFAAHGVFESHHSRLADDLSQPVLAFLSQYGLPELC